MGLVRAARDGLVFDYSLPFFSSRSCLKAKKDAVFDPSRYTHSRVMTLLCQASPFKDTALEAGLSLFRLFLPALTLLCSARNGEAFLLLALDAPV